MNKAYNMDCLEAMRSMKDNEFSLAITDPPYGINISSNGKVGGEKCAKVSEYKNSEWDNNIPTAEYFSELLRVSQNQIIWGGNYMIEYLYNTPCFIVWDKENTGNFADAELAWTSFDSPVRIFKYMWNGMLQGNMKNKEKRIHITQKPIALYKWLLKNYAKEGYKILDTHLGSGSSRIACHEMGFDFVGYEIDKDYFDAQEKRFKIATAMDSMFPPKEMY
jgi:site-specific DNA-methyltransferase (adenine-specific)